MVDTRTTLTDKQCWIRARWLMDVLGKLDPSLDIVKCYQSELKAKAEDPERYSREYQACEDQFLAACPEYQAATHAV